MKRLPSLEKTYVGGLMPVVGLAASERDGRADHPAGEQNAAFLRETAPWAELDHPAQPSLVGQTVGSYEIRALLGEGAVGSVYLAEHPVIRAQVAIKVLHEEIARVRDMGARFVQEARAANRIPSPHVVRVSDFGKLPDGRDYAVMEYLEGEALSELLAGYANSRPEPARAVYLAMQAADAMAVAHAHGVVHRDLKPENLFVEQRGGRDFLRILDFGIAQISEELEHTVADPESTVIGTPLYCSPEQAAGRPVTPACDVYALGVVLYELLTGHALFEGSNVVEILTRKASPEPLDLMQLPVGLPSELSAALERCLAREPAQRPSMHDLAAQLRRVYVALGGDGPLNPAPPDTSSAHPAQHALSLADEPTPWLKPRSRLPQLLLWLALGVFVLSYLIMSNTQTRTPAAVPEAKAVEQLPLKVAPTIVATEGSQPPAAATPVPTPEAPTLTTAPSAATPKPALPKPSRTGARTVARAAKSSSPAAKKPVVTGGATLVDPFAE